MLMEVNVNISGMSWKEVTEFYLRELDKDYPEGFWVDSAESSLSEVD